MTIFYSDKRITEVLKSGKEEEVNKVFRYLYKTYFQMGVQFMKKNSGDENDAEDVFQEVMIGLYQNVRKDRYRGDSSMKTYLYAMIRNQWLIRLKDKKRSITMDIQENVMKMQPSNPVENAAEELNSKVKVLLENLSQRCREILSLYYFDNFSMNEIANLAGYDNENSVKTQKYKCMQRLIAMIEENPNLKATLSELLVDSSIL